MDGRNKKLLEVWIGIIAVAIINCVLFFIPGWHWFIWFVEWIYILPACVVLWLMKRPRIVGGILICGGVWVVLDIAYCGYASTHGGHP